MSTLKAVFNEVTPETVYLERMLRLARLSNDEALFASMVSTLSARLMDETLQPTAFLIIADQHHIRELQGVAYYAQLMALLKNDPNDLTFPAGFPLTKDQRVRLLAGYWSLGRKWESVRCTPFKDSPPCLVHGPSCAIAMNIWRNQTQASTVTQYASADVLGKVRSMQIGMQNSTQNTDSGRLQNTMTNLHFPTMHGLPMQQTAPMQAPPSTHPPPAPHMQSPYVQHAQQMGQVYQSYIQAFQPRQTTAHCRQPCVTAALGAAQKILDDIQVSLPDYFSDSMLGLGEES